MERSPSAGKTITIAGTLPLAIQDILNTVLHDVWGLAWATPSFTANLMIVAVAITGAIMHTEQRKAENNEYKANTGGSIGGAPAP